MLASSSDIRNSCVLPRHTDFQTAPRACRDARFVAAVLRSRRPSWLANPRRWHDAESRRGDRGFSPATDKVDCNSGTLMLAIAPSVRRTAAEIAP